MHRLSEHFLLSNKLPSNIEFTNYARHSDAKVIHLGVGAFHRAHQAAYFDQLNEIIPSSPWMIMGASLRSKTAAQQLNPQDGLFLHLALGNDKTVARIIRSLCGVINAFENPNQLVRAIAAPSTQLITLSITEKGYCIDPATGELDLEDPGVIHDCANIDNPQTAIGHLVAGLARRFQLGCNAITVLSCDNLSDNGALTRKAVVSLAGYHSADLADWIDTRVSFPSSMVDRIAPAVTDEDYAVGRNLLQADDLGLSVTEEFTQWVIEDDFVGERPPLERVGATFVKSVRSWEERKLRLLNAAHSAMAYMGGLAGIEYVHQAVKDPQVRKMIYALWRESLQTIEDDDNFDANAYCQSLIKRFSNPSLNHRLQQIAIDGSEKIPVRILAPINELLKAEKDTSQLTETVATWIHYQRGKTFKGGKLIVEDPMSEVFRSVIGESTRDDRRALDNFIDTYEPLHEICVQFPQWTLLLKRAFFELPQKSLYN